MEGREIFKNAVRSMAEACDVALQQAGLTADDVDLLIPHQANVRIIEATAKYAGIDMERGYVNGDRYGNMSSASVPRHPVTTTRPFCANASPIASSDSSLAESRKPHVLTTTKSAFS